MKKNKIITIIIFLLFCAICIAFKVLNSYKNKEVKTKNENFSVKYANFMDDLPDGGEAQKIDNKCDLFFPNYKDKTFEIVKYDGSFYFLTDGCANSFEGIFHPENGKNYDDEIKNKICDFELKRIGSNFSSSNIINYNKYCKGIKTENGEERTELQEGTCNYDDFVDPITIKQTDDTEYKMFYKFDGTNTNFSPNYDCSISLSLPYIISNSDSTNNKDEICGKLKSLYSSGMLDIWDMESFDTYCSYQNVPKKSCSISNGIYTGEKGNRVNEQIYKDECNMVKITFNLNDGENIKYSDSYKNSYYDSSIYISVMKGENNYIELPDVTNFAITGYGNFKYWSLTNDCGESGSIMKTEKNHTFNLTDDVTYYACFEKGTNKFEGDVINNNCSSASAQESTITNQQTVVKTYKTTNDSATVDYLTYNKYCPIKCTETFNVTYPSAFETIKSGTYFNLMYNPQVMGKRICTSNFNFDYWNNDYLTARKEETIAKTNFYNFENKKVISGLCNCTKFGCSSYSYEFYRDFFNVGQASGPSTCNSHTTFPTSYRDNLIGIVNTTKLKRNTIENQLTTCQKSVESITKDQFYKIDPKMSFSYEGGASNKVNAELNRYEDTKSGIIEKKDAINYSEQLSKLYSDDGIEATIPEPYTAEYKLSISRTVIRSYQFSPKDTYYVDYRNNNDGGFSKDCTGSKCISLGKVYPVLLNISGKKDVSFNIEGDILYTTYTPADPTHMAFDDAIKNYSCSYNVTNDIVVPDKSKNNEYKINFYERSISTSNVDPNKRFENGTLGENWASDKGQKLINVIQERAKNNNTYNPKNLEYSFILTPNTIDKIRNYNKEKEYKYNNSLTDCNIKEIGLECKSEFLTNFVEKSQINGIAIDNSNSMTVESLNNIRKKWKYFIHGSWEITSNTKEMTKDDYERLFKEEGVLP